MNETYPSSLAKDYHYKRRNPWKPLEEFIMFLKQEKYNFDGIIMDLGCGNGRNFNLFRTQNDKIIGVDNSLEFLKIAKKSLISEQNSTQLLLSDLKFLPIRPSVINYIFLIASFHHIRNSSQRNDLIHQIDNILQSQGRILLTVWRKYQKKYRFHFLLDYIKRKIVIKYKIKQKQKSLNEHGDIIIPWTVSMEGIKYERFYHLFSKRELLRQIRSHRILAFQKLGGSTNKDNFFIFMEKINHDT
jgi:SAM-dependent methyltransferase